MSTHRKLLTVCCAAVLAFGLAACGSSDNDTAGAPIMETPKPMPVSVSSMPGSVSLPANLPDGHEPAAGIVTIAAGSSASSGGVAFSCAADGEDCAVTIGDGGSVTSTGGTVTASLTQEAMDVIAAAAAKMTAQSLGLSAALAGDIRNKITDGFDPATPGLMIKRGESGPTSISKTGWAVADAPHALTGWHGNKLTKQLTSKHELMVAYTDIDPPKREEFDKVWPEDNDAVNLGVVTINFTAHGSHLDKDRFPQAKGPGGGDTEWTYGTASTDRHVASFSGRFQGAQGTYSCAKQPCSVTVEDSARGGDYTPVGDWTFTPDSTATVVVQNGNYMHFGFWKEVPDKANTAGDYAFQFRVFAGGSMPFVPGNIKALEGTVKYSGPAVGIYTTKTIANGQIDSANYGVFAADAKLTAAFGDHSAMGDLDGKITNFRGGDGMDDWSVTLSETSLTDAGIASGTGMTTAKMGTENGTGNWDARLFGPSGADSGTPAPSGIAGTFNADFSAARIAGSYGAQRQ